MANISKVKFLFQLFFITIFILLFKSCMEPINDDASDFKNSFDIIDNIMDPNGENLNLDFEQGLDFWRFNSKKALLNDINHSIQMDISNDQFSSGNQSLKLELVNEKFTAARYFSLSSGDSLFTTMDVLLNLDSNHVFSITNPYRIILRISYFNEDLELLTSSGFTTTSVSKKEWTTLSLTGCLMNPFLEFVRFDLDIYGYDSIPIYVDNLKIIHKPNPEDQNYIFDLQDPTIDSHFNLNDTTFFSWQDVINDDATTYTHKIYILLEEDNLLLNSNFESPSTHFCTQENNYPGQWWMFPFCWDWEAPAYDPYSAIVSNDISRSGEHSLRLRGLYSDSLKNFNTVWQWLSMAEGMQNGSQLARPRVLPGSALTFEGYIFTPDSNMISGSNTVELGIWAFNERDENWPSISPVFDKTYTPNEWHKFSVTATIPEWKNTGRTQCGIYLRYNQYNNADGVVYIDDLTVSSDRPYRYHVNTEVTNEPFFNWGPTQKNAILEYWRNWSVRWDNQLSATKPHAELDTMNFEWEVIVTDQHDEVKSANGPFFFSVSE